MPTWLAAGGAVALGAVVALWLVGVVGARPLKAGVPAPHFCLPDQDGRAHCLADYRGAPVVLAFYPADRTPGCTLEARSLRDSLGEFADRGVRVLGISTQGVESKRVFCDREGLTYPLLADAQGRVAAAYGVRTPAGFARRVSFVIDGNGRIAKVVDRVDVRRHASQLLDALEALDLAGAAGA